VNLGFYIIKKAHVEYFRESDAEKLSEFKRQEEKER
jgi:hypothetical protein